MLRNANQAKEQFDSMIAGIETMRMIKKERLNLTFPLSQRRAGNWYTMAGNARLDSLDVYFTFLLFRSRK